MTETEFEIKNQKLINADWRDILPTVKDRTVDLLLTDPPYNITPIKWDKKVDWKLFWEHIHRVCKPNAPMVLFASGKFVPELLNSNLQYFRYELIWEKTIAVGFLDANRRPLRAHEQILIFCRQFRGSAYTAQKTVGKAHTTGGLSHKPVHYSGGNKPTKEVVTNLYHPRSVLKYSNAVKGNKSLHPTAKPLELLEWLVKTYSKKGDFILEPFAGSGTTLAASMIHGRKSLGVELGAEYFETAKTRLINLAAEGKNGDE